MSASGLVSGEVGSPGNPAANSLWLGEMWPRAFGSGTSVTNFQDGVAIADGPDVLDGVTLIGGDAVLDFDGVRVWLAYGVTEIDSSGGSTYDRTLTYWIAEVLIEGEQFSPHWTPFYLGLRANGLGTYNSDEGYFTDIRLNGTLGYNVESSDAYSVVLGWRIADGVTLRTEYTIYEVDLVRGVTADLEAAAEDLDYFSIELGIDF